ncbi:MAG: MliC family protein [Myxococcales bacterium]
MMERLGTCLMCALAVAACAHRPSSTPSSPEARGVPDSELTPRGAYSCASGQSLATQFDSTQQQLALSIDNTLVRLDQVPSGSGSKFSNGQITFWNQGQLASLEVDGVRTDCQREISR